ncbi:MAG: hypothetical protein ABRQ37_22370 [Candidatus Eremiobacterota bacterium]
MTEEDKMDILEKKIKNKIAFQQEYSTNAKFDDGFIQAMNNVLNWVAKLKRDDFDLIG